MHRVRVRLGSQQCRDQPLYIPQAIMHSHMIDLIPRIYLTSREILVEVHLNTIPTDSQPKPVLCYVQKLRKEENIIVELDLKITSQPGLWCRSRPIVFALRPSLWCHPFINDVEPAYEMSHFCTQHTSGHEQTIIIPNTIQFIVQQRRLKMKNSTQRASFLILHFVLTKEKLNYVTNWIYQQHFVTWCAYCCAMCIMICSPSSHSYFVLNQLSRHAIKNWRNEGEERKRNNGTKGVCDMDICECETISHYLDRNECNHVIVYTCEPNLYQVQVQP